MAKQQKPKDKNKNDSVRIAKAKTPAQLEKKARNEALAAQRLANLQAKQTLANTLRQEGFLGTDDQVIEAKQRAGEAAEAEAWVSSVLKTRYWGAVIQRWLKERTLYDAIDLKPIIVKFLKRPQNAEMAAAVAEALNPKPVVAAPVQEELPPPQAA